MGFVILDLFMRLNYYSRGNPQGMVIGSSLSFSSASSPSSHRSKECLTLEKLYSLQVRAEGCSGEIQALFEAGALPS